MDFFAFDSTSLPGGWLLYPAIFFGGMALNLTPCVYPLIPVTLSHFSGGHEETSTPMNRLGQAVLYVLGISVTYSALGTVAAISGGFFGAALQSPWVLGGLSLLFLMMALSEFGIFHLPSLFGGFQLKKGPGGSFLMGLLMGFVAAPCLGPVVVGLLAMVAQRGDPVFGFLLFMVLSLGLGLPYLFLAYFANSIHKLPRSGRWLGWAHYIFGVLLLGLSLWYAWPLVKNWVGPEPGSGGVVQVEKGSFQTFSLEALKAVQGKKPIMIDTVADWCAPCKELELQTFSDPRVKKHFEGMALFKLDLTMDPPEDIEKFLNGKNVYGVPTVMFVDREGDFRKDLRLSAFEEPEPFLKRLEKLLKD